MASLKRPQALPSTSWFFFAKIASDIQRWRRRPGESSASKRPSSPIAQKPHVAAPFFTCAGFPGRARLKQQPGAVQYWNFLSKVAGNLAMAACNAGEPVRVIWFSARLMRARPAFVFNAAAKDFLAHHMHRAPAFCTRQGLPGFLLEKLHPGATQTGRLVLPGTVVASLRPVPERSLTVSSPSPCSCRSCCNACSAAAVRGAGTAAAVMLSASSEVSSASDCGSSSSSSSVSGFSAASHSCCSSSVSHSHRASGSIASNMSSRQSRSMAWHWDGLGLCLSLCGVGGLVRVAFAASFLGATRGFYTGSLRTGLD